MHAHVLHWKQKKSFLHVFWNNDFNCWICCFWTRLNIITCIIILSKNKLELKLHTFYTPYIDRSPPILFWKWINILNVGFKKKSNMNSINMINQLPMKKHLSRHVFSYNFTNFWWNLLLFWSSMHFLFNETHFSQYVQ
jgi:hypothetical protein